MASPHPGYSWPWLRPLPSPADIDHHARLGAAVGVHRHCGTRHPGRKMIGIMEDTVDWGSTPRRPPIRNLPAQRLIAGGTSQPRSDEPSSTVTRRTRQPGRASTPSATGISGHRIRARARGVLRDHGEAHQGRHDAGKHRREIYERGEIPRPPLRGNIAALREPGQSASRTRNRSQVGRHIHSPGRGRDRRPTRNRKPLPRGSFRPFHAPRPPQDQLAFTAMGRWALPCAGPRTRAPPRSGRRHG